MYYHTAKEKDAQDHYHCGHGRNNCPAQHLVDASIYDLGKRQFFVTLNIFSDSIKDYYCISEGVAAKCQKGGYCQESYFLVQDK